MTNAGETPERSHSVRLLSWLTLSDLPTTAALVVIALLFPISWAAAMYLGGSTVVAPHWFYVPIFLAGMRFGPRGALAAGVVATVVAGPLLPANTATGAAQATGDWLSRGVFFILIGLIVTYLLNAVRWHSARTAHVEAQSEGEQRFRALMEQATDMIIVLDSEGRLTFESPAVERFLGWSPGQRIGRRGVDYVHPADRQAATLARQRVLADSGTPRTLELRVLDSGGAWHWVESTMTNLIDEPTVLGIVINHRVVDERKVLEEELIHRAFHDSLTGLANRGLLRERVERSLGQAATDGQCHFVLFIDLDDFKTVNDGFGHDAGDRLLVEFSRRLLTCVNSRDLVARLGGDEFAVLIEHCPKEGDIAGAVAQRVIDALEEPFDIVGHQMRVSASIGITQYEGGDHDADSILMQADIAMYDAKANGKDQYAYFCDAMQEGVRHRLDVESWLRSALVGNQIRVHYQPIVVMGTRRLEAVEALVRWQHPTMGLLSPVDFLGVAEDTGLIVPLGKLVLRDACEQIRHWREEYDDGMKVSVNLSATQLRDPNVVDAVRSALAEAGVGADALIVEVTESALIGDVAEASAVLASLSAFGVTIAIDDFGTGYSSLSHLQEFPVDVIKVDKSFVDGVCRSSEESTLVRSVLAIGSEFGLQVVAEGIQTDEQDAELRRLGCDYGQGYLYMSPVPAEGIDRLLQSALTPAAGPGNGSQ